MAYGYAGERLLIKRQACPRCSGSVLGGECVTCGRSITISGLVAAPAVDTLHGRADLPMESKSGVYDPQRAVRR